MADRSFVTSEEERAEIAELASNPDSGYSVETQVWNTANLEHPPAVDVPFSKSVTLLQKLSEPTAPTYLIFRCTTGDTVSIVTRRYDNADAQASSDFARLSDALRTLSFVGNEVLHNDNPEVAQQAVEQAPEQAQPQPEAVQPEAPQAVAPQPVAPQPEQQPSPEPQPSPSPEPSPETSTQVPPAAETTNPSVTLQDLFGPPKESSNEA